jgi:dynein heavy chain 1, cytosolic
MASSGETVSEVKFWLELENELAHIETQLKSPEAECTLNALKQAKRFHATVAFDTDTIGLKKAIEKGTSFCCINFHQNYL